MKFTSFAIALLAFAFSARPATVTYTPGTGVLLYPENFFEANSNSIVQAIAGAFPGTGSGNASTNVAQGWSALQVFDDVTVTGTLDVGALNADSFTTGTPIGLSSGGHGATNAAGARSALGVDIGADVQAWSAYLQQLATVGWASGDMPWYDGSNLTNLATTAAGRTLLTAATASAQWAALLSSATTNGTYDASSWDGITDRAPTLDQIRDIIQGLAIGSNAITQVTSPLSLTNGVLSIDTSGLGGGGGFTYILTNSLGAWQGRDTSTNWTILSTTISSNDLPTATGKFIEGGYSGILSNNSGTTATAYLNVLVGGTLVFSDSYSYSSSGGTRPLVADFRLVRESSTTASLIQSGNHVNSSTVTVMGMGDFGSSPIAASIVTTNITVDWTSDLAFAVEMYCDTSTSTNEALGIRPVSAWMRRDATASSGSGDVVGPASSTTNNIAVFADATGKVIADGGVTVASFATEAEVAAGYEPLNANKYQATNGPLTTLATLNGSALTNLNASSIASGTLSSNLLPAAVSFTTIDVDTINASAVVGDASGLTGINATNVTDGELADARIPAAIARDSEVSATYAPLASPALTGTPTVPTAAAGTSNTVAASTKYVDDAVADIQASSASAKSHTTFYIETEFLAAASAIYSGMPWAGTANASGSSVQGPASGQNRPTISRLSSAANANSGYAYTTYSGNALRLHGGERFTVVFRPQATNDGVITRYGWHDTTSSTAPTDALMVVRSNFVMTGYAYSNSVVVPTATTYNISSNAWYRLNIAINGDGSVGTFTLFDESASQVWSDSVTNALPLSDARLVGNGVNTYNVNAAAVALEDFDFMSLGNTNILTR